MDMRKFTILLVLLAALSLSVVVRLLVRQHTDSAHELAHTVPFVEGEIVHIEQCDIPEQALKPFSHFLGADGIRTILRTGYRKGMPLVEISFLKRALDRGVVPFPLSSVELSPLTGYGGSTGLDGAHGIRLAVSDGPNADESLAPGGGYRITQYIPVGGDTGIHTAPLNTSFRVPENLPPDTVYRVKLIIKDEILEEELLAQKKAEEERERRIAEEEKITVTFTTVPDPELGVIYRVGKRTREAGLGKTASNTVVMEGPNALGGELFVLLPRSPSRCWAYIKKLQTRSVTLPQDADLIVQEDKLVEVSILLNEKDLPRLAKYQAVSFYISAAAKLPLFGKSLRQLAALEGKLSKKLSVKMLPGTYYVRVGDPTQEEIVIGKVSVNAAGPNNYTVKLPD